MFISRYQPDYLDKQEARMTENDFNSLLKDQLKLSLPNEQSSDLTLDGGNVVDGGDMVVIAKRALSDNSQSASQFKTQLEGDLQKLGITKRICLLDDQGDTTGHADGYVSFLDQDTVLVGDYGYVDEYQADVDALQAAFGDGLGIHKLPCYESSNAGSKVGSFDSAEGAYINMLVSDTAIYVPVFAKKGDDSTQNRDIIAADQEALNTVRVNTNKKVLSVNTRELSHMGGSVRCMSWQLYVDNPIAKALMSSASNNLSSGASDLHSVCILNQLAKVLQTCWLYCLAIISRC
jgi:agmatine/peptidylarginine deiminase